MRNYVFIDESIRDSYVMAAVIVPINRLGEYRKAMAGLRTKGSLAFHMRKESLNKRSAALKCLMGLQDVKFIVASIKTRNGKDARKLILSRLALELDPAHVWNLVLDRSPNQRLDFEILIRLSRNESLNLEVSHASRYEDVGLWGPDILAWYASKNSSGFLPRVQFLCL